MLRFKPTKLGYAIATLIMLIVVILIIKKRRGLKRLALQAVNFVQEKTWDIVSDRRINTLHPIIKGKAKELIIRAEKELGIKLRVTSALRTWDEQNELFSRGRSKAGKIVTNARAGQSLHNYGLALDVVEIKNGRAIWDNPNWQKIGDLGKSLGFTWGGAFRSIKDKPHFEMKFGKSLSELQALYRNGKRDGEFVRLG